MRSKTRLRWPTLFIARACFIALKVAHQADANEPSSAVRMFALHDVRLLDSPFRTAMGRDQEYMLRLEPDRLLSWFRKESGLAPKGAVYGGWESRGVAGHTLGHYLSACAEMFASTGDARFVERVNYIVDELAACQDANGNGYVGAIPDGRRIFGELARGEVNTEHGLNGGWVPWYTVHKTLAGLRDAYTLAGNVRAKAVLIRLCDWTDATTAKLTDAQFQKMLSVEHGGMVEELADVYEMTGDAKYLRLSRRFTHHAVIDPLVAGTDRLAGLHDNTQIPKLIGSARRYELTGDADDCSAATFFWETVVRHHTYVIGGHSEGEHFGPPDMLATRTGALAAETCNTYNTLKLTRHLFEWKPSAEYTDYAERALYNHILPSQDARSGMFTYFVSLKPGHFRTYSTPFDSMWCCVGTGFENHATYGASIYAHDDKALWINLFIPSVVMWQAKNVVVEQQTKFPEEGKTRLTIKSAAVDAMPLRVRHPAWAGSSVRLSVNGQTLPSEADASGYLTIDRVWNVGDRVDVDLPMTLHTESLPDEVSKVAVMYGPLVLAGRLGTGGMIGDMPFARGEQDYKNIPTPAVPLLVTEGRPVREWVKRSDESTLSFHTIGVGRPADVELVPFYQLGSERYSIYWDTFTAAQWDARHAVFEAEQIGQRALDARTVDTVRAGEQQSDQDHAYAVEKSEAGTFHDRSFRHALPGGWFSYEMKVDENRPMDIVCTYWGGEGTPRRFEIVVDGQRVGTQALHDDQAGEFFDVNYAIPDDLTRGKAKITVKFNSLEGKMAGGVFACRTLRRE